MTDEPVYRLVERLTLLKAVSLHYVDVEGYTERKAFERAYLNVSALTEDEVYVWEDAFCPN